MELTFNKPQQEYLATTADIVLFGGGAGSGKSYVAIVDLLGLNDPIGPRYTLSYYRAVIYRKRRGDLIDLIDKSKKLYPLIDPNAKFNNTDTFWEFSSGAKIYFRYFERYEIAETFLQGQEFACICAEEVGQFEDDKIFKYALSRLRNSEGLKCYMRGTCNPSKYKWLREYFNIDDMGNSTDFIEQLKLGDGTIVNKRIKFIRASLKDNPYLPKEYEAQLMLLPKEERDALLYGRWDAYDSVEGQIYESELKTLLGENRYCIVRHDKAVPVSTAWDLGISDKTTIIAFQIVGKEIRIINFATGNNKSIENDWIPTINKWSEDLGYNYDKHYIPHDARQRDKFDGNSIETKMRNRLGNVEVLPMHRLLDGINATRTMFANVWIDKVNCAGLLDDLQKYRREYDTARNCWKNDPVHDDASHTADAFRYISYVKPKGPVLKPSMMSKISPF